MFKLRSFFTLLSLAAVVAIGAAAPAAHGQSLASTAALSGTVSDPSGARVPNASVTLESPEKGIKRTFKTDAEGSFSFALLPAATYTLTVQVAGFKTYKQEGITLEVGQSATQGVTLSIGTTEQIEVSAAAPLLQTDNANVGQEISTKQVTELPLNLRNVFNFVQLNSSVNNGSQQQTPSVRRRTKHGRSGRLVLQLWRWILWNHCIPAGRQLGHKRGLGWRHLRSLPRQCSRVQGATELIYGAIRLEHRQRH